MWNAEATGYARESN